MFLEKNVQNLCYNAACCSVQVLNGVINRLARYGVIYHSNTERMSKYQLLRAREQFRINGAPSGVMVSNFC